MKTLVKFLCISLMAVVFSACSNKGPDKVAVKFYEAFYTCNVEETVKLTTETSRPVLTVMLKYAISNSEECKNSKPQIKVLQTNISESGSSADVELEVSNFYDKSTGSVSNEAIRGTLHLVKVNDEWKVALDY